MCMVAPAFNHAIGSHCLRPTSRDLHSRPSPGTSLNMSSPLIRRSPTTGADLPAEIIDQILSAVIDSCGPPVLNLSHERKKTLGACALTCRHWARRCRRKLFASLSLRSRDDVRQLLWSISHPIHDIPSLKECRVWWNLEWNEPQEPWIHQLLLKFPMDRDAGSPRRDYLELSRSSIGSATDTHVKPFTPSSLSASLPRTLPWRLLPIAHLHLFNLRFRHVRDLFRLVHSVGRVYNLHCMCLTFEDEATWASGPRFHATTHSLKTIIIPQRGDPEAEANLAFRMLSAITTHQHYPRLLDSYLPQFMTRLAHLSRHTNSISTSSQFESYYTIDIGMSYTDCGGNKLNFAFRYVNHHMVCTVARLGIRTSGRIAVLLATQ